MEPGTWTETIDAQRFSENIKVEWEELYEMENPEDNFSFLNGTKVCKIGDFETQDLFDALKQAPLFDMKCST